jgi:hypothetical protein
MTDVAVSDPEVAVMVAVPSATAVTSPVDDNTVATAASDVAQVTVAPLIVSPFASFTVAVNATVSPTEDKVLALGDTSMVDATWATVTLAVAFSDPVVAVIVAVPSATAVTSPADDTVATAASDVSQVTVAPLIVSPFTSVTVAVS